MDINDPSQSSPRQGVACLNCRQRKKRCDRRAPKCSFCERRGYECIIPIPAAEQERPTQDISEQLRDELARLERHLRERTAEERTSSYQSNLPQPDIPATASLPVERSTTALEFETPVELGVLGELNAATIYDRETYHLGRMIIRALSMNDDQTPNVPSSRPSLVSATFLQDAELQPRRVPLGLLSLYLDNYFRHVHPTFPMLSESTVRQCLRTLCSVSNLASAAADRVVLYLVLALGSLLSDEESSYDSCYSARFFHSALQEKLTYRETIDTVHILILFTLYSLFDTNAGSSWHLVDLAMRTSIILGLHHSGSSSSDAVASSDADPTNDVTFWSVYLLDRWISLALAQPVTLPNFEIRTRFPSTGQVNSTPFQRLCYWAFKISNSGQLDHNPEEEVEFLTFEQSLSNSASDGHSLSSLHTLIGLQLCTTYRQRTTNSARSTLQSQIKSRIPHQVDIVEQLLLTGIPVPWPSGYTIFQLALTEIILFNQANRLFLLDGTKRLVDTLSTTYRLLMLLARRFKRFSNHACLIQDIRTILCNPTMNNQLGGFDFLAISSLYDLCNCALEPLGVTQGGT